MSSRQSTIILIALLLLTAALLGGVFWASNRIAAQGIGGEYFWVQRIAIRSKVIDGVSPYSPTVMNRLDEQVGKLYNWVAAPGAMYTDPLFSAIITLPYSLIQNSSFAHAAWLFVQFVVILLTILAGIRLTGWKPSWWALSLLLILIMFSLRTILTWYQGSMMIWVAGMVTGVLLAIQSRRFELAGFLLALNLILPQVMVLFVTFVLLWAAAQRKWRVIFWFFSSLIILCILAAFLVPNWLVQYLRILWNFSDYFPPGAPGFAFQQWWPGVGKQMGWALSVLLGLIILVEWWLASRREFRWFLWTSYLTVVGTVLIGLPTYPDVYILLTLPLLLIGAVFDERWKKGGKWVVLAGTSLVFAWEWYIFLASSAASQSSLRLVLIFPTPVLLFGGMYWIKWWAIRPKRLLIDELRASEIY